MKKSKLIASLCVLILSLACLTFGVYSAVKTTFTASGTITFNAYGVDCLLDVTISGIQADSDTTTDSTTHLSSKILKLSTFTKTGVTDEYTKIDTTANMGKLVFDELNANLTDAQRKTITISIALKNYSEFAVQLTGTVGTSLPTNLSVTLSDLVSATKSSDGTTATDATGNYTITLKANGAIAEQSVNFANLTIEPYTNPYQEFLDQGYVYAKESDFDTSASGGTIAETYKGTDTKLIVANVGKICQLGFQESNVFNSTLTDIIIGDEIKTIYDYAFSNCSNLKTVLFKSENIYISTDSGLEAHSTTINGAKYYLGIDKKPLILIKAIDKNITAIEVQDGTKLISSFAFLNCKSLAQVDFPSSLKDISAQAFSGCTSLTSITIPSSVTSFNYSVFLNCTGLESIQVEAGNTVYDSRNNCNAVIETSTNTLIAGIKNTIIPNTVTSIGSNAFQKCSGLTAITIPNSVTSIGSSAFSDCSSLERITIPSSVTSIDYAAFNGCTNLANAKFENATGWSVSTSQSGTYTSITTPTTEMTAANATLLKTTYRTYYWKRG